MTAVLRLAKRPPGVDAAEAAAYGWHDCAPDMPDEAILRRLLALNLGRAADKEP